MYVLNHECKFDSREVIFFLLNTDELVDCYLEPYLHAYCVQLYYVFEFDL